MLETYAKNRASKREETMIKVLRSLNHTQRTAEHHRREDCTEKTYVLLIIIVREFLHTAFDLVSPKLTIPAWKELITMPNVLHSTELLSKVKNVVFYLRISWT